MVHPTRHLQLLTREHTEVDVIDMFPPWVWTWTVPRILFGWFRDPVCGVRFWLRTASGQRLAYATSWWEASHVDEYLQNRSLPIWASLARLRTELYRDVQGIYFGECPALEGGF